MYIFESQEEILYEFIYTCHNPSYIYLFLLFFQLLLHETYSKLILLIVISGKYI
jgi:hypothetical protein